MFQLWMEKSDLDAVPQIPVPAGYHLRTFRTGDEKALAGVYAAADLGTTTAEEVRKRMINHPCFKPERIFVVDYDGGVVGTSAAWIEQNDPGVGYLHMVGVLPEHRGRRLGALLAVASIGYTRQEGFAAQRLFTDDWRAPAIHLYLNLGYYPLLYEGAELERWETLARRLGRPDALREPRTAARDSSA